jgi:hypothetical protein
MMKELENILHGEDEMVATETDAVEAPEPVETAPDEGPVRDDQGRFAPKGVEESAPPAPTGQLPQEEFKALKEERTKRQNLERELAEIRAQLSAQPQTPPPSIWEDEQGWQQNFGSQVVSAAVQQATVNAKLDMSEMMARQANPDFDEMKAEFLALADQNPTLAQQALSDPHPWHKAYQIAKTHRTMTEVGATDVDALRAKIREELMAEMAAPTQSRPTLPPTLSGERSVASRGGPAWTGPRSLGDLLS